MQAGKTASNQEESPGNENLDLPPDEYASPAALLRDVADRLDGLCRQVDHIDATAHEIDQKLATLTTTLEHYQPLLERFADPAGAVRGFFAGKTTKGRH